MNATDTIKKASRKMEHPVSLKLAIVGVLILLLHIPLSMVESLIHERDNRKQGVISEINHKWGQAQTITGPIISIPYLTHIEGTNGKTTTETRYLHFLPDTVNIDSKITPEVRYRGIYEAVLYNTKLIIEGSFRGHPLPICGSHLKTSYGQALSSPLASPICGE